MKNKNPKMIVIVGPTASGKSNLGIFLAKKFGGEIISADSRQVYRGMNIGTGKVTKKEQGLVKHHLLDVAHPKKVFTVFDFKKLGQKSIINIIRRNKVPFIVGGTGFYIDALVKNSILPEVPPNSKLRKHLDKLGTDQLFKMLRKLDPKRSTTIDRHNKRRLVRALEIVMATGKPVPKLVPSIRYQVLWLGLKPKNLDKKIKLRLEARLKQGMVKEVKNLLKSGVSHKRLYDLGLEYRWISEYLQGKITKKMLKTELLTFIIKYSKRQMTWFKRNKDIHWIKSPKEAEKLVKKFISPLP